MQKSFWIVVLPLFLILLFGVSSACSFDSGYVIRLRIYIVTVDLCYIIFDTV
ncbi:hypothetical protein RchiOBHm_Chr5g0050891 [Rosa chinensis]|uniref:Uncharacterized protein n=1 Tax=Rosa chinensis TaxID=74649 RepID=A0A2P6QF98_ROSCH|nr:hypothetical protein RchiOBHm_Chr5g0050891 [Rosa chinensis]